MNCAQGPAARVTPPLPMLACSRSRGSGAGHCRTLRDCGAYAPRTRCRGQLRDAHLEPAYRAPPPHSERRAPPIHAVRIQRHALRAESIRVDRARPPCRCPPADPKRAGARRPMARIRASADTGQVRQWLLEGASARDRSCYPFRASADTAPAVAWRECARPLARQLDGCRVLGSRAAGALGRASAIRQFAPRCSSTDRQQSGYRRGLRHARVASLGSNGGRSIFASSAALPSRRLSLKEARDQG
jgi:hypothetical protein